MVHELFIFDFCAMKMLSIFDCYAHLSFVGKS